MRKADEQFIKNDYLIFLKSAASDIYKFGLNVHEKMQKIRNKFENKYLYLNGQEQSCYEILLGFFDCSDLLLIPYKYLGLQKINIEKLGVKGKRKQFFSNMKISPDNEVYKIAVSEVLQNVVELYDECLNSIPKETNYVGKTDYKHGKLFALDEIVVIITNSLRVNKIVKEVFLSENVNEDIIRVFYK